MWIFAVRPLGGYTTEEFRWDGKTWTTVPGTPDNLVISPGSAVVLGAADVWAVGSAYCLTSPPGCSQDLFHWNGLAWSSSHVDNPVQDIAGAGHHVWLVALKGVIGTKGHPVIYQWTGANWQLFARPYGRKTVDPSIAASPAGDLWMMSSPAQRHGAAIVYHWTGRGWTHSTVPARVSGRPLFAYPVLTFDGHSGFWASANAHWDGRRWIDASRVALPPAYAGIGSWVAPIPGTFSSWAIGDAQVSLRSTSFRNFVAVFGKLP